MEKKLNITEVFEQVLNDIDFEKHAPESIILPNSNEIFWSQYELFPEAAIKRLFRMKAIPVRTEPKKYRNELCKCGSGKKYKFCCINK